MVKTRRPAMSPAETEILRLVWQAQEATVQQIYDALPANRKVTYMTVATLIRRLEEKGYLRHRHRGKAFVYRTSELRFDTDFYVEFLVPPAAMLGEQTARALDRAKVFMRVAGPGAAADADWVLDGFASALYADTREAGKPAAELDMTYYLTRAGGLEQTPVWTREYRQRVPMRDASPLAYAESLNRAFGEIVAELARDLAAAQLPKR